VKAPDGMSIDLLPVTPGDRERRIARVAVTISTVHASPTEDSGVTTCCDRSPFELPRTDRMTVNAALVTCRS
jgi:hypothetical protein